MLNLFKSNSPGVVVFYLFYLVVFRIYAAFFPLPLNLFASHSEPLSCIASVFLAAVHGNSPLVSSILAGVLCFLQAMLINKLVNDNKILPRKNYLAGLLFIIVVSFFKQGLLLSPALLALTFLILAAIRIFALIRKEKASGDIFDVGLLVAIASLFYFPCILLIVFTFFGIATVRSFNLKEWIVALSGFVTPFFVVFTWYFWHDQSRFLFNNIANLQGQKWMAGAAVSHVDAIVLAALLALTIVALVVLPNALYSSLIQVRKYASTLVLLVVLIGISFTLQQTAGLSHWVLLALPLSIIFSIALTQIRNKLIVEVFHLMLILLVLAGQYLPLLNVI